MALIAGHEFKDGPNGRRCVGMKFLDGVNFCCNASWLIVREATAWDVENKTLGLAHNSWLTMTELDTIHVEKRREEDAVWHAIQNAASR